MIIEIPDDFIEFSAASATMSVLAKKFFCDQHRGPWDLPPTMLYATEDDIHMVAMNPPTEEYSAPESLDDALHGAFTELGVPKYVAVCVEAYVKRPDSVVTDEDLEKIERGELQRAFNEHADPTVSEAITCFSFDLKGNVRNAVVFYKYDDKGQPDFDDPYVEQGDEEMRGAILSVVNDFVKFVSQ